LDLSDNNLDDFQFKILEKLISENNSIKILDLSQNLLKKKSGVGISKALQKNKTLSELNLGGNKNIQGKNDHITSIFQGWRLSKVKEPFNLNILIGVPLNNILTKIDLSSLLIGNKGVELFSYFLKENKTLSIINLACNGISACGFSSLFGVLSYNTSVTKLNIKNNTLGMYGAMGVLLIY
jgi:Ran GTPase-activating protein (RanGAP) involved in mRNA processing and transport